MMVVERNKREVQGSKVYIWRGNMVVFGFGFDRWLTFHKIAASPRLKAINIADCHSLTIWPAAVQRGLVHIFDKH